MKLLRAAGQARISTNFRNPEKECLAKWISTLDGFQRAIAELAEMMRRADASLTSE